ncbi:hypothetical protein LCGC14_0921000 [marine sediment metagenome]|uniref:Uncharacterized protein n=1 Tax=marine sediment metagenome TaxID=412755 RepID=A0A0F9R9L8_9ZZZZ
MLDLPAIEKLCEAATPEPWTAELDYVSAFIPDKRPNGEIIGRWWPSISGLLSDGQRQANAEFAARARTLVPQLVEALEEAQGKLKAVREWRKRYGVRGVLSVTNLSALDRILKGE